MKDLKKRFKAIYTMYESKMDSIEKEFEKLTDTNIYASEVVENNIREKNRIIRETVKQHQGWLDEALIVRKSKLTPDTKIINSLEYQTKLANTINLLNLDAGAFEPSNLDFIVEARDINTFTIIKNKYSDWTKTPQLLQYTSENDIKGNIEAMEKYCEEFKGAIQPGNNTYWAKLAIHNALNEE